MTEPAARACFELFADDASQPFFDCAQQNRLAVKRCTHCRQWAALDQRTCLACGRTDLEWNEVSGLAKLVTWSVVHHAPHPALKPDVPYVCGIVELDEGPWLYARLVDVNTRQLAAGGVVRAVYVRAEGSAAYPVFAGTDVSDGDDDSDRSSP